MFLTEKYISFHGHGISFHGHGHDRHSKKLHNYSPKPFEEILIFRLKSLPPLPPQSSSPSIPLSWLVSAVRLLTSTLSSFASLLSDPSLSGSDPRALSSHLDSSSASLLDAANTVSAEIDRLTSLRLHLRLQLRRLLLPSSSSESVPVWDPKPAPSSAPPTLLSSPPPPPRGKINAVRRAIYAVEAVSALVVGSVLAGLGHDASSLLSRIRVPAEYPWADAFNSVASAVHGRIGAAEIAAVGTSAERLKAVLEGKDEVQVEEAVAATDERTEEMAEGLEALGHAVDGLFRAGLLVRNAAMQSFRAGLVPKTCK